MSEPKRTIIGFVCERSLPIERMLDANKALLDDPETKFVIVPCSGMVKPTLMEAALANGADATFVCGCAIGDCHYRTGNLMIRERLEGKRNPKLRKTTDRASSEPASDALRIKFNVFGFDFARCASATWFWPC